jgi:hypothetical protein
MPEIANKLENVKRARADNPTAEVIPFPKRESNGNPVFPVYAMDLYRRGFAVLPLEPLGKSSLVSGFNKWGARPGEGIVGKWCETMPLGANIGIIPGLGKERMVTIDCDTMDAAIEFQDRFGKSNRRTGTRRAVHLMYKSLPFRPPGNLRKWGIDADIKSGNQYAVAPHSVHESLFEYTEEGDWSAPLAQIDAEAFKSFVSTPQRAPMDAPIVAEISRPPPHVDRNGPEDSRGLWMNRMWCANTDYLRSFDEVLMMGFKENEWLAANHERGRLPEEEILARARQYWNDVEAGRLKRWGTGYRGFIKIQRSERQRLKARGKGSTDAIALLTELRSAHPTGSEFKIVATAMAAAGFMPRKRIEKARAMLMQEGLIEKVRSARMTRKGPVAAEFKFTS